MICTVKMETQLKIVEMASKYNFYPTEITYFMNLSNIKYLLLEWGFILYNINKYADADFEIKFIFIKPKYRRKGILTKIIKHAKKKHDIILYTSNEKSMDNIAIKEHFHKLKVTRCGTEHLYAWSCKYSAKELMKLY